MFLSTIRTAGCVLALSTVAFAADPTWTVSDGQGGVVVVANAPKDDNYVFHSNGADTSTTITVKNKSGVVIDTVVLAPGTDPTVGVPKGGSIELSDNVDSDTDGASGTYQRQV